MLLVIHGWISAARHDALARIGSRLAGTDAGVKVDTEASPFRSITPVMDLSSSRNRMRLTELTWLAQVFEEALDASKAGAGSVSVLRCAKPDAQSKKTDIEYHMVENPTLTRCHRHRPAPQDPDSHHHLALISPVPAVYSPHGDEEQDQDICHSCGAVSGRVLAVLKPLGERKPTRQRRGCDFAGSRSGDFPGDE
jgi:hypothetical protein